MHHQTGFSISTAGQGLYEFTDAVRDAVRESGVGTGLATIYVRHTSCSLIIQENADPDVQVDLRNFFARLVPPSDNPSMGWVTHTNEGPDDMPAHIKAALNQVSISVPVSDGVPVFGTWQGIYLFEHRDRPHQRRVVVHVSG